MMLIYANPVLSAPRTWRVSAVVLTVHAGIIAFLASGLARPVVTPPAPGHIIMASVVLQATPPAPKAPSPPAPTPKLRARAQTPVPPAKTPPRPASAAPVSTAQAQPTPVVTSAAAGEQAPVVPPASSLAPAAAAPAPGTTGPAQAVSATARTPAPSAPAPAAITPPSADARYLANPPPPYPRLSKRLGEQGTVVLRVRINTEGRAEEAAVHTSSGYPRLDEAALETVQRWRYVPGQRNGVPETQWFKVPIRFVLD